jgi:hypothetical protein
MIVTITLAAFMFFIIILSIVHGDHDDPDFCIIVLAFIYFVLWSYILYIEKIKI